MREVKKVGKQETGGKIYPRLTLTGQLQKIGIEPGDEVLIEVTEGAITIRARKAAPEE